MIPGTKFYYDRHGRYRGKRSPLGPISMGFWSLVVLVGVGYVVVHEILEMWWFLGLIVSALPTGWSEMQQALFGPLQRACRGRLVTDGNFSCFFASQSVRG